MRRVITGLNNEGKSIILIDEAPTNDRDFGQGISGTDIWATETSPADNTGDEDMGERTFVWPPESGTIFRYLEFDPGRGVNDPGWHATDTIDYVVVIQGEIYCMMEEGEVLLKAGDMLVQRGTNHAWVNRASEKCVLVGIMVSAVPLP